MMHRRGGHPTVFGNLRRFAWVHQRLVDDQPALATQGARIVFPSTSHSSTERCAVARVTPAMVVPPDPLKYCSFLHCIFERKLV